MANNLPANVGDVRNLGLIPRLRRSLGVGHGNLLQYPGLENPVDKRAWQAVHGVTRSPTLLTTNISWGSGAGTEGGCLIEIQREGLGLSQGH